MECVYQVGWARPTGRHSTFAIWSTSHKVRKRSNKTNALARGKVTSSYTRL